MISRSTVKEEEVLLLFPTPCLFTETNSNGILGYFCSVYMFHVKLFLIPSFPCQNLSFASQTSPSCSTHATRWLIQLISHHPDILCVLYL